MSRLRVSIAGLMAVIVVAAVGIKALKTPTPLWAGLMYTIALAGLAVGLPGVIYRRGGRRAFWVGFAIFGWGYWLVSLSPWVGEVMGPKLVTNVALDALFGRLWVADSEGHSELVDQTEEDRIRTEFLSSPRVSDVNQKIEAADQAIIRAKESARDPSDPAILTLESERTVLVAEYDRLWKSSYPMLKVRAKLAGGVPPYAGRFLTVGHGLFTLLSALLGGIIAVRFHHTRDATPCPDDERSATSPSTT